MHPTITSGILYFIIMSVQGGVFPKCEHGSRFTYSLDLFNKLIDKGVCREQARGVLPQNMYTEYYGTCNLSNLLKFIDLRLDSHAQWEIQKVAQACLQIAEDLWPVAVESYRNIKYGEQEP